MKPSFVIAIASMLCTGCASIAPAPDPAPAVNLLYQADARVAAADYAGAQTLYTEFVNANPDSPQAARARATQAALDRLLSTQAEPDRVNQGDDVRRLRREIAKRQGEVERLKAQIAERHAEVEHFKAENAKLRGDLERLKSIDLETLPGARK